MESDKPQMTFSDYWQNIGARTHVETHEERARLAWEAAKMEMMDDIQSACTFSIIKDRPLPKEAL